MQKVLSSLIFVLLIIPLALAEDSTNPADYLFYDMLNGGSKSDSYTGVDISFNNTLTHDGGNALEVTVTGTGFDNYITNVTQAQMGSSFCIDFWSYYTVAAGNNEEGGLGWGTGWGVMNLITPQFYENGVSLKWGGFFDNQGNWVALNINAQQISNWEYNKYCFSEGYAASGTGTLNITGTLGSLRNQTITTTQAYDRNLINRIHFNSRISGGNFLIDNIRVWNASKYGYMPPPASGGDTANITPTWDTPAEGDAVNTTLSTFTYIINTTGTGNVTTYNASFYWNGTLQETKTDQSINGSISFTVNTVVPLDENISSYVNFVSNQETFTVNSSTVYVYFNVTSPTAFNSNISSYSTINNNFTINMNWTSFSNLNSCGVKSNYSGLVCTSIIPNGSNYVYLEDNSQYNGTAPYGQYNKFKTWNINSTKIEYIIANSSQFHSSTPTGNYIFEFGYNDGTYSNSSSKIPRNNGNWATNKTFNPNGLNPVDNVSLYIWFPPSHTNISVKDIIIYGNNVTSFNSTCTFENMTDVDVYATAFCSNSTTELNQSKTLTLRNINYINFTAVSGLSGANISNFSVIYSQGTFTANGISLLIKNWIDYTDNYSYYHPDSVAGSNKTLTTNVSLQQIQFDVFTVNSINFTFKTTINNTLLNYRNITLEIISDVYSANYTIDDATVYLDLLTPTFYTFRYSAPNFTENFYYFELENRSTNNISLYLLEESEATEVTINVYDFANNLLADTYIRYLKYDLITNSYLVVGMAKTDSNGEAKINVLLNQEFYRFQLYYPFDTLKFYSSPDYIFETTLNFQINLNNNVGTFFHNLESYFYNLTYNNNTNNFKYEFYDSKGLVQMARLDVYKITPLGKVLYNSSQLNSTSGIILVYAPYQNNTQYIAEAILQYNPEKIVQSLIIDNTQESPLGRLGLFGVFLVSGVLTLALGSFSIVLALIALPLPFLLASLIKIISIHWVNFLALQIVAIIIGIIIEARR